LNPERLDESLGRVAVGIGRRDAHRAAVTDVRAPLITELVALGVSAEVVVIVEDQDLLALTERAPPEMRGRQPGDAAADDDEVVLFVRVDIERGELPVRAALETSERLDRGRVVAAQPGARGWIGVGRCGLFEGARAVRRER